MANTYSVMRVLGSDNRTHHNNKWGVYRTPDHSSTGEFVEVFAGKDAKSRADAACAVRTFASTAGRRA